ncbi:MAG: hypothetical protein JXQ73_23740 [Phycisphaerae bacterium]|nr:hypothetical protein [Phycisphaerae bacterium]
MLDALRRLLTRAARRRSLAFQVRYRHFKGLLEANSRALEMMADISATLAGSACFSMGYVRRRTTAIFVEACKIVRHMEAISPDDARELSERLDVLRGQASACLAARPIAPDAPHILDMADIDRSRARLVGNKMASIGEVRAKLGIPVPDGFAVTARLDQELHRRSGLQDRINSITAGLDYEDQAAVQDACQTIQSMVVGMPLSESVEQEILAAYDRLGDRLGGDARLAVRSSAIGEDDPRWSCAGLYYTALNVSKQTLIDACYEVEISKYLPRSLMYFHRNGLREEDMPMCIGCVSMVDAAISGTLFTEDPAAAPDERRMTLQAVVGLGIGLVNGRVLPERYLVAKDPPGRLINFEPGGQTMVTRSRIGEGVEEQSLPRREDKTPSLDEAALERLAEYAIRIERHFGGPQDIEWAIDRDGEVWILQTRPLQIGCPINRPTRTRLLPELEDRYDVLAREGDCASAGVGIGPVVVIRSIRQLRDFPKGGVLVTRRSMPELVQVLHKVSAVVTEIGGTAGHLAIVSREYRVPCLMNVPGAASWQPGLEVTVDADARRVYAGRVAELEPAVRQTPWLHPLTDAPVYQALRGVSELVLPLNLRDPTDPEFRAAACRTIHDISRFAHETAMNRMFAVGHEKAPPDHDVHRLVFDVPLNVYVIDVGGGLVAEAPPSGNITPEQIASPLMQALIRGMTTRGVRWTGQRSIGLRGFMSVMATTMADPNRANGELGDRSYAVISRHYMNFSSRLGYHFSTVDAYVGDAAATNHVSFSFKGGAADSVRRGRRVTFIARVLEEHGFWVEQKDDFVKARVKRIERDAALQQLVTCGRLMGAARLLDVTMTSDAHIDRYVERFLSGDYSLGLVAEGVERVKTSGSAET